MVWDYAHLITGVDGGSSTADLRATVSLALTPRVWRACQHCGCRLVSVVLTRDCRVDKTCIEACSCAGGHGLRDGGGCCDRCSRRGGLRAGNSHQDRGGDDRSVEHLDGVVGVKM